MSGRASEAISDGRVVSIHYKLTGEDGEIIDNSFGGEPLIYLHGAGNIVLGLEESLTGHRVGDTFDVVVSPDEGYGVVDPELIMEVPRENFPEDVELAPGVEFSTDGPDDEEVPVWVKAVTDDTVTIDFNHPLAGRTLNFEVTVAAIRAASKVELDHGHPHTNGDGHGGEAHGAH